MGVILGWQWFSPLLLRFAVIEIVKGVFIKDISLRKWIAISAVFILKFNNTIDVGGDRSCI